MFDTILIEELTNSFCSESFIAKMKAIPTEDIKTAVWNSSNNLALEKQYRSTIPRHFSGSAIIYPTFYNYHGLDIGIFCVVESADVFGVTIRNRDVKGLFLYYDVNIHGFTRRICIPFNARDLSLENIGERITVSLQNNQLHVLVDAEVGSEWVDCHSILEKEFNQCIPLNLAEKDRFGFTLKGIKEKYDILLIDPSIDPATLSLSTDLNVNHSPQVVTKYGTFPLIYWLTLPVDLKELYSLDKTWELKDNLLPLQHEVLFSIPIPTSIVRFIRKWKINTNIFTVK